MTAKNNFMEQQEGRPDWMGLEENRRKLEPETINNYFGEFYRKGKEKSRVIPRRTSKTKEVFKKIGEIIGFLQVFESKWRRGLRTELWGTPTFGATFQTLLHLF